MSRGRFVLFRPRARPRCPRNGVRESGPVSLCFFSCIKQTSPCFLIRLSPLFLSLLVLSVVLAGCGTETSPDRGDWTMKPDGLRLTDTLRVSETDNFYFGSVEGPAVTSTGRMVVGDDEAHNLKVLAPDGTLIDTLGGEGEGPGEFQSLSSVQVARGDSLYVYDRGQTRLTVYAPDSPYERARSLIIPPKGGTVMRTLVLDDHLVGGYLRSGPSKDIIQTAKKKGRVVHAPTITWRRIEGSGSPQDTFLVSRRTSRLMPTVKVGGRVGLGMAEIPFARRNVVVGSPDARLYSGWTDSLHVTAHSPGGTSAVVASIPTDPVPIRESERDSGLANVRRAKFRDMVASVMSETKPAFTDLVVSDEGRLWVQRPAEDPDPKTVPWWILNPETKTIQEVRLPPEVTLEVVQDGKAYGTTKTKLGAPAVVRYRIES